MRRPPAPLLAVVLALAAACGGDGPSDAEQAATFCERLERLADNDPFAAFGDRATSDEVATAFEALVARAEELEGTAPDEARPAAREYAEAAAEMHGLLRDAAYDAGEVDARAYREQQVRYAEAARTLERHLASAC